MLGDTIELLEALPIFKGLSRRQLGNILDVASKVYFEPGENLVTRYSRGDTAYLILTGAARCLGFPGNPVSSETIGPGCLVGELAMLSETVHSLTIQAKVRARALALRREDMRWVMQREPGIAEQISENLLTRLQDFASDLRRLDDFLAYIEDAAPVAYRVHTLPEQPRTAVALLSYAPAAPLQRLLQGR